jgi:hypothetical protein
MIFYKNNSLIYNLKILFTHIDICLIYIKIFSYTYNLYKVFLQGHLINIYIL